MAKPNNTEKLELVKVGGYMVNLDDGEEMHSECDECDKEGQGTMFFSNSEVQVPVAFLCHDCDPYDRS